MGRYAAIGGVTAWRVPALAAIAMVGALAVGEVSVACGVGLLGVVLTGFDRSITLEVSPRGLTQGLVLDGAFVGPAQVLSWSAVEEIRTSWRGARDFSVLHTTVSAGDATAIGFSSRMGLAAYRALLQEVARRAPDARRSGLTEEILREPQRSWRAAPGLGLAAITVAVVALALALLA